MNSRSWFGVVSVLLFVSVLTFNVRTIEGAWQDDLAPETQAIVAELRQSLPSDSEARAMLESILKGSTLGPNDGWFPLAKAQSRYGWDYARDKYDRDRDGAITADEFGGSPEDFARLDRDNNRRVTAEDFDWSKHSLTPSPGSMFFFAADQDSNGKISPAEFAQLFERFGGKDGGFLSLDEVVEKFAAGGPPRESSRSDRPSKDTLIAGLKKQEIGSLQSGPNVGDMAPDFMLLSLQGEAVTLSQHLGSQPIVLIFGNFTCGPFRSQAGNIEKLYARYRDRAKFFLVYVREAHPSDGWWMTSNERAGIDLKQPETFEERFSVAQSCQQRLEVEIPFLVDTINDQVGATYSGMPNRLYLIDAEGKIAFKNGRGPFGFHPRQLEQALVLLLND